MRIPRLILSSDRWSQNLTVLFDNDLDIDCIPDSWIDERKNEIESQSGELITRENVIKILIDELHRDNEAVDEYRLDCKICRCDNNYYKYNDNTGCAEYINDISKYDFK